MNVKKIIKGIMGLSAVAGIAYLSYKVGESNGEINERFREKYGDEDDEDIEVEEDDDYKFYDNYDEPDDGCIAPIDFGTMNLLRSMRTASVVLRIRTHLHLSPLFR